MPPSGRKETLMSSDDLRSLELMWGRTTLLGAVGLRCMNSVYVAFHCFDLKGAKWGRRRTCKNIRSIWFLFTKETERKKRDCAVWIEFTFNSQGPSYGSWVQVIAAIFCAFHKKRTFQFTTSQAFVFKGYFLKWCSGQDMLDFTSFTKLNLWLNLTLLKAACAFGCIGTLNFLWSNFDVKSYRDWLVSFCL